MCDFRDVRKVVLTAAILCIVLGLGNATSASAAFNPIRVHSGGGAYTDSLGQVWSADTGFSGGNTYSTSSAIANTKDPALYQTERWGSFSYNFAAPTGTYVVTLKFAEIYFTGAGHRFFGVSINGVSVLSNFDIAAQAGGANIALDKTFQVNSTGNIQIQFITGSADNPKVDAIQIVASSSAIAPTITTQPISQSVTAGQSATFSVAVAGTAPMSYQWQKNGIAISGANASSYTTPTTTTSDKGTLFVVVVSNSAGNATSNTATLNVAASNMVAPLVTTQPASQSVAVGQTATFSVAATGTAPMSFQWRKNGTSISGATSSTYTTPATTTADNSAQFSVAVSNSAGSVISAAATLTVNATAAFNPIRIHSGGAAYTDSLGQVWNADTDFSGGNTYSTSSSIANTKDPALYQTERWGSFTYNFAAPAGTYAVTLKFAEIYFTSTGKRLFGVSINGTSVLSNFDILAQAGGANIALDKTFQVNSTGNIQIQFITGSADNPKVDAIQIVASTSSSSAIAPTITTQPASQSVAVGQTATFSVAATGTAPMSYQWRKNGTSISAATSSTYTTPATTTADNSAQFSVVLSNGGGSATSAAAILTVNASTSLLNSSVTSLSFGNVNLSTSASQNVTFTNAGTSNVSISNVSVSGAGFNASGISVGTILTPGQTATLTATFMPAAIGIVNGSVTLTSTASNSPAKVTLTGAGIAATSHSAQLSWTASTSTVMGYNCYSSTVTGGPYVKLNTVPVTPTSYMDTTVQSGKTYYYVVTSVDSNNVESAYSSEISAAIP